jgi:hypothetical protein
MTLVLLIVLAPAHLKDFHFVVTSLGDDSGHHSGTINQWITQLQ